MNTITLTQPAQCNNCQRKIETGETVTAKDESAVANGAALCSTCAPLPAEKPKAEKKNK